MLQSVNLQEENIFACRSQIYALIRGRENINFLQQVGCVCDAGRLYSADKQMATSGWLHVYLRTRCHLHF